AARTGTYRVIATSQDGVKPGPFTWSLHVLSRSGVVLPKGVPPWFTELDKNGDGQIALHEWRKAGKKLDEFRDYDLDDDGFITVEEILQCMKKPIELKHDI